MTDIEETLLPADRTPDGLAVSFTATTITVEAANFETGGSCGTFNLSRRVKPSVWRAQNELQRQAYGTSARAQKLSEQLDAEKARSEAAGEDVDADVVSKILNEVSKLGSEANDHAELFAKSVWADQWPALVEALEESVDGENWISICSWLGRIRAEVTAYEGELNAVPLD